MDKDKIATCKRKVWKHGLILLLLCGLILLAMWPWARYFTSGFPSHFDPPFHAWKLQVEAEKLLSHHRLIPDANTNVYYPNANELYFDALLWPQGVLAALLKVLGCNPVLTYNLVFLFFWGLSGLFMYMLLRKLKLRPLPAFFGAAVMCLIPYRISYYVEFNMQMCFGLPLFLLFWVRYAKRPNVGNAIGLAISFWLQAVSELYQAVFLILSFPLIILPFIPDIFRKNGRSWRFYVSIAVGCFIAASLCFLYLDPYFTLMHVGYRRSMHEMARHSLEPLAYLGTFIPRFLFHVNSRHIKGDEMNVFPSITLLILVLVYGLVTRRIFRSAKNRLEQGWIQIARWVRLGSIISLLVLIGIVAHLADPKSASSLLLYGGNGLLILILTTSCVLVLPAMAKDDLVKLNAGLAAAAALCFALSLGPILRVFSNHAIASNEIFSLVNKIFPLHGLRVMSRFSIMVMIFLILVSSRFLNLLSERRNRLQWFVIPTLLLSLLVEAQRIPRHYRKFNVPVSAAVLNLIKTHPKRSVVVLPLGNRRLDGGYMLAIGGTQTLLVNGWGGFIPKLQQKIAHALKRRPALALSLINSIWPKPYILIDKKIFRKLRHSGYATTERWIGDRSTLLVQNPYFPVYEWQELPKSIRDYSKLVRGDILRKNPCFTFQAKYLGAKDDHQALFVFFNGTVIGKILPEGAWRTYNFPVPVGGITELFYETLSLRARDPQSWLVKEARFRPLGPGDRPPSQNLSDLAKEAFSAGYPAWPDYVVSLPSKEKTGEIDFRNGIKLVGMDLSPQALTPGQSLDITTYWTCPPLKRRLSLVVRTEFKDASQIFMIHVSHFLPHVSLSSIISQPIKKIFYDRSRATIPKGLPPGKYQVIIHLVNKAMGKIIEGKKFTQAGSIESKQPTLYVTIR